MTAADLITAAPGRWTVPLLCRRLRREPADVERELATVPRLMRGWRGELSITPEPKEPADHLLVAARQKRAIAHNRYMAVLRAAGLLGTIAANGTIAGVLGVRADYVRTVAEIIGAERVGRDPRDTRVTLWRLP